MHIVIYGAGGIGCALGASFHRTGYDVTFIARGTHLEALQQKGLRFITDEGEEIIQGNFVSEANEIPAPDYLFLTTKSHSLPAIAKRAGEIVGPNTLIIPVINGIPWWHFYDFPGELQGFVPRCLDPEGGLQKYIPKENLIGGVVYAGATVLSPGTVEAQGETKLSVGEPATGTSERLQQFAEIIEKAGFTRPATSNIYKHIWRKLCWNIAFNPLCALEGVDSYDVLDIPERAEQITAVIEETKQVIAALNIPLEVDTEERIEMGRQCKGHKPSMLQDVENGKLLEIDAILTAVIEIADTLDINTPTMHAIIAEIDKRFPR